MKSPPFTQRVPLLCSLVWLPVNLQLSSKSVYWPTKSFMKNNLFIFTQCLPITPIPFTEIKQRYHSSPSLGLRPTRAQGNFSLVPLSFGKTSRFLSVPPPQFQPSGNIWKHVSLTRPFAHRHQHARWPVDITGCFMDFAVARFSCHGTEPGLTGDIGTIDIWWIDINHHWDQTLMVLFHSVVFILKESKGQDPLYVVQIYQ